MSLSHFYASAGSYLPLFFAHEQVIGLNNVPLAGDEFEVVDSLDVAREKAESQADFLRNERISAKAGDGKITLSSFASAVSSGKHTGLDLHQLNIILKVDVQVFLSILLSPNYEIVLHRSVSVAFA